MTTLEEQNAHLAEIGQAIRRALPDQYAAIPLDSAVIQLVGELRRYHDALDRIATDTTVRDPRAVAARALKSAGFLGVRDRKP